MINLSEILMVLTPLPIITVFLSGLLIGFIYVRKIPDFNNGGLYHHTVLTTAFFVCLTAIRFVEGVFGWERWIGALILYLIYIIAIQIAKSWNKGGEKWTKLRLALPWLRLLR